MHNNKNLLPIADNLDYFMAYILEKIPDIDNPNLQKIMEEFSAHFGLGYFKKGELEIHLLHNILLIKDKIDFININEEVFKKLKDKYEDLITNENTTINTDGNIQTCQPECNTPKDIKNYIVSILNQSANYSLGTNKSTLMNRNLIDDYKKILSLPNIYGLIDASIKRLQPYVYEKYEKCQKKGCLLCRKQSFKDCENDPNFIDLKEQLNKMQQQLNQLEKIKKGDVGVSIITATKANLTKSCIIDNQFIKFLNFNISDKTFEELGNNFCSSFNNNLTIEIPKGDNSGGINSLWELDPNSSNIIQPKENRLITSNNKRIIYIADPEQNQDATNKRYVDSLVSTKQCKLIAGENINIDENTCKISASSSQQFSNQEVDRLKAVLLKSAFGINKITENLEYVGSFTQYRMFNDLDKPDDNMVTDPIGNPKDIRLRANFHYAQNMWYDVEGNVIFENYQGKLTYKNKEIATIDQIKQATYWKPVIITNAGTRTINIPDELESGNNYKVEWTWGSSISSTRVSKVFQINSLNNSSDIERFWHSGVAGLTPNILAIQPVRDYSIRIYEAFGRQETDGFIFNLWVETPIGE